MQENVGQIDRWVRFALGGALVLGGLRALTRRRTFGGALALTGGALVLESAITRVCPVNALLGVDTRSWDGAAEQLRLSADNLRQGLANGRVESERDSALRLGYES